MPYDRRAARLIARLRDPDMQRCLAEGFESSLSAYLLEQWEDRRVLTDAQITRLEEILAKYKPGAGQKKGP